MEEYLKQGFVIGISRKSNLRICQNKFLGKSLTFGTKIELPYCDAEAIL